MRVWLLAIILASAVQPAAAQSTDVRGLTRSVVEEVCLPFWSARDLEAAEAAAGALRFRRLDERTRDGEAAPFAVYMGTEPGGNRLTLALGDTPICSLSVPEATVATMAETARPLIEASGYTAAVMRRDDPSVPIHAWRRESDVVIVSISDLNGEATILFGTDEWTR